MIVFEDKQLLLYKHDDLSLIYIYLSKYISGNRDYINYISLPYYTLSILTMSSAFGISMIDGDVMGYYKGVKIKLDDTKHDMNIVNYIKFNYKYNIIRKLKLMDIQDSDSNIILIDKIYIDVNNMK